MAVAARAAGLLSPETALRLGSLQLVARTVVEGFIAGLHRSVHHGSSVEFAQHRPYTLGDDPRRLDWRVWAKTDRFYVRQYDEETNTRVYLILDASASMGYGSGGITKFQYARLLAAALGYLTIRQRDPTGLVAFADQVRVFVAPRLSRPHYGQLLAALEDLAPGGRTAFADSLQAAAGRLTRRGLIVLLSDLLGEPDSVARALAFFRHRKHEVIVFHLLDPAEQDFPFGHPTTFADLETGERFPVGGSRARAEYQQQLGAFLAQYRQRFAGEAIDYSVLKTSTPFDLALGAYLCQRSRLS